VSSAGLNKSSSVQSRIFESFITESTPGFLDPVFQQEIVVMSTAVMEVTPAVFILLFLFHALDR